MNGAPRTGSVQVFTYNATFDLWVPLGFDLLGTMSGDGFGEAVEISLDGEVVSVSSTGWVLDDRIDGNSTLAGYTKVFELGANGTRRNDQPTSKR